MEWPNSLKKLFQARFVIFFWVVLGFSLAAFLFTLLSHQFSKKEAENNLAPTPDEKALVEPIPVVVLSEEPPALDAEADQIMKLQQLGMKVTRPDVAAFKAKMGPAYERMKASVGANNLDNFLKIVEAAK